MAERKAKPPIPEKIKDKAIRAINRMEDKQIALTKQAFSANDLLALFVDPAHHHVLTEAYRLCEPSHQSVGLYTQRIASIQYGAPMCFIHFGWSGRAVPDGFYVPYAAGASRERPATLRIEAPPELVEKFMQVADEMIDIHYRFAMVTRVLTRLNRPHVCKSLAALSYHWPCIVPILRSAGYEDVAESVLQPNSRAGDLAALPSSLRPLLAPTNQTIATHQLIAEHATPEEPLISYHLIDVFPRV